MVVKVTETVLRDANQSLIATRMPFSDFASILEKMDSAGYHSLECWGGATFDSCLRYLNEDPWERLRKIKARVKKTPLQMLLRGQSILGYKHYPDDVVIKFVQKSIENGIDIIRIFDALNDIRNMKVAIDACNKANGHAQGTICYTISPIHTLKSFVKLGKDLQKLGCKSLAIKDMAGIMSPKEAFDLVSALKEAVKIPIFVHTHCTTGLAEMTYLKAVEAGADGIDCAISSFAGSTAQPATESLIYALNELGYSCGVDPQIALEINNFFKPVKSRFLESGDLNPAVLGTKTDVLIYQIPGGMLSNLIAQLKAQNALDRLGEVLAETPKVRAELGYPPLVTPLSQMVGVQATSNVITGERYKNISKEIISYIHGEYGKPPGKIDPELVQRILGDELPITTRFAEKLPAEFKKVQKELGPIAESEEDVLSYIVFPQLAEKFFAYRQEQRDRNVNYSIRKISQ